MLKVSYVKLFCVIITVYHLLSTHPAMLLTWHTHPSAHTCGTLAGGSHELTFRRQIKSHLPFSGIIRRLSYSTHFQDKGQIEIV
jgi:hypothetical protein